MKQMKYLLLLVPICIIACHKESFLNAKPSSSIVVPTTLADFQSLIDNAGAYSTYGNPEYGMFTPYLGTASSDEYFVSDASYKTLSPLNRNCYTWKSELYSDVTTNVNDWNFPYNQILYANVVLDNINKVSKDPNNSSQWNAIYGGALFLRAYCFYNLVSEFASAYDSNTANSDLGIVLKRSSDINEKVERATVQQTYDQLINDLKKSIQYLPSAVPNSTTPNRASKPAAYALLARIFLSMRSYESAKLYADSCLSNYHTVVDFNTLQLSASYPFQILAPSSAEVMYLSVLDDVQGSLFLSRTSSAQVDTSLVKLFDSNDLRKQTFLNTVSGQIKIGRTYSCSFSVFSGLATDEAFLIRAECNARNGQISDAMNDINLILKNRYKSGTFTALTANSSADALSKILLERRKELIFRGVRWTDLKRLNKEGANLTLTRTVNGQKFTLSPNSPLYVLPIPPSETSTSGIQQNIR